MYFRGGESPKKSKQVIRLALDRIKALLESGPFRSSKPVKNGPKDPAFLREYEALEPEFRLARQLIEARYSAGLSQQELAHRVGTSRSKVARLESDHKPSIKSLERYAKAAGVKL